MRKNRELNNKQMKTIKRNFMKNPSNKNLNEFQQNGIKNQLQHHTKSLSI